MTKKNLFKNLLYLFIFILSVSGCIYKPAVRQGNVFAIGVVDKIHIGMNRQEVEYILGGASITHKISDNSTLTYLYTEEDYTDDKKIEKRRPLTYAQVPNKKLTLKFNEEWVLQSKLVENMHYPLVRYK